MTQEYFLAGVTDWGNHRPLLWLALEETQTGDVIEMGCGDESTKQLHDYCKENKRVLFSFDTDQKYIDRFAECASLNHRFHLISNNWDTARDICPNPSVILIDHGPGERRIVDVERFAQAAKILVLHDTQPPPTAADYGWEKIWHLFKYRITLDAGGNRHDNANHNRTWASAVSNHIDITKWAGLTFKNGEYVLK